MAFMFWYGGKLLAEGELDVGDYFIIYMAAMFGGQAAGFAFGYFAGRSQTPKSPLSLLLPSMLAPPAHLIDRSCEGENRPEPAILPNRLSANHQQHQRCRDSLAYRNHQRGNGNRVSKRFFLLPLTTRGPHSSGAELQHRKGRERMPSWSLGLWQVNGPLPPRALL